MFSILENNHWTYHWQVTSNISRTLNFLEEILCFEKEIDHLTTTSSLASDILIILLKEVTTSKLRYYVYSINPKN